MNNSVGALGGVPAPGLLVAGRYRVCGRIGRGTTSDVLEAHDEVLHRSVALKVFRFDSDLGSDRRRVDAEVRLLASLHHPGLVTVYDAGTLDIAAGSGTPYLVMELVDGPTVSRRLESGPMSATETAALGRDLAAALDYIHGLGVVHRDIKPANVILSAGQRAGAPFTSKLTDFGIALMIDGTRLTMDGFTIGTANYLSPEQATGGDIGPPSDIYSLGLVLIQCLTGQLAFPGSGMEAVLARLRQRPVVPTEYGPGWAALLASMTEREPQARPTAEQALSRLSRLVDGVDLAEPSLARGPTPGVPAAAMPTARYGPARTRGRRLGRRWAALVLVALVGSAAAIVGWGTPHRRGGANPVSPSGAASVAPLGAATPHQSVSPATRPATASASPAGVSLSPHPLTPSSAASLATVKASATVPNRGKGPGKTHKPKTK